MTAHPCDAETCTQTWLIGPHVHDTATDEVTA